MRNGLLHVFTLLCLLLLMTSVRAEAFAAVIKGKVIDDQDRPVEYATAVLIKPTTKEIIKGEVCDSRGEFRIEHVDRGEYILSVSMVGFEKFETETVIVDGKSKVIEKTIILREQTEMLEAVEVVAKKQFAEQDVDKMIINPDVSITSASESVYDILRKVPGVTIDNNDNISLKGMQGVKVMIDDKPTYLSADQLASYLKSMQGKNVERIEIIENPSAKYDAEGNSGIINIKTKHIKAPGFNGSVNGGISQSSRFGWNGGIDLNMNYGKLNLYGNYSNYHWAGENSMTASRRFTSTELAGSYQLIDNLGTYNGSSHNYKVGADYYLAKNHVVSVMFRGNTGWNRNDENSKTSFTDKNKQVDSSLVTVASGPNDWKNATWNLNYKWDIDTLGQSLSFDMDYATFGFDSSNRQDGKYYDANDQETDQSIFSFTSQGNDIDIVTSKLDYVLPVSKQLNVEAGLKASFVNTNSHIDMDGFLAQHDRFLYEENIQAAYLNARFQLKKTAFQLGLRLENTMSKGTSVTENQVNDTSYLKLFPSFFVQHQLNDHNSLNFRYSYRIGRPSYHHLNPFRWMVDPYTYNIGNPHLRPQFTHAAGLSYNYKGMFITNLGANYTKEMFTDIIYQDDAAKTIYQTRENLNNALDMNISETVQFQPFKWWRLSGTVTGMYKAIRMTENTVEPLDMFSLIANMNNQINLPWGLDMEISGYYASKQLISNITALPQFTLDLGFQKKVLKDQGVIKLSVSDIFKTANGGAYIRYENVDMEVMNHWDSRELNLTFSYRFGKDNFKTRANRSTSSSEEQNRSSK